VSALSHVRVLELADGVTGEYCGKLLADFGAEVIKIEPPGAGSGTRRRPPLAPAGEPLERSGLFAYLNTNKRSVCLDPAHVAEREMLHALIRTVDAVVDDHPRGHLESIGIDPSSLAESHPGLIVCSVTPFGYDAPAEMQNARSLNVFHSSGWGYHCPSDGNPDGPPLKGAGRFLVDYESGLSAALALAAATYRKQVSGRGQFIDVSQQASMASLVDYVLGQMVAGHMDASARRQAFDLGGPATFFRCLDGYVYLWLSEPTHWRGLATLMDEPQWMREFPERWLELHVTPERIARCRTQVAQWMRAQPKSEVAARAQKLGVPLVPVNTLQDILASPQLAFREFFTDVAHPTLGNLRHPTVPYRLSATPARIASPAPRLGDSTDAVIKEVASAAPRAVPGRQAAGARQAGPLSGVRVLELTKVWAGPYVGKLLALLGAEVIRVESWDSIDATRRFGTRDVNEAPGFQAVNPGKRSVQLSTKSAEGRRLLGELVKRCDMVIENLRPGAADRMGFGYEGLRSLKPDIVAVSMSMHGHDGPLAYQSGYAPCFSALAGICELVGYRDGPPRLLNIRYGDSSFGTAAAFAAVVALCHRRASGQGQHVDVSAVESLAALLGDCFQEYALTGHMPTRDGNQHPEMAPHGTYPCLQDEWISLAVATDAEWHALCDAMGHRDVARDPRFADLRSRHAQGAELDQIIAAWTRSGPAGELATRLRQRGIAAYKSLSSLDLVSDETLWRRGFFPSVTDSKQRSTTIVGAPWRFSVTPATIERSAPTLGQDNDYVLGELLGLTSSERQSLINEKVIY
jgi:crotonobetainyl-CoA:carnitine CoA-transferase CaiB-like acyl-CoA transferase